MLECFKEGAKLTMFTIGCIASTNKAEIVLTQKIGDRWAFKMAGKRKEYYLKMDSDNLIFIGHNLPIIADSEIVRYNGNKMFAGNACINVGGRNGESLKEIKKFIIDNLQNPVTDEVLGKIIFHTEEGKETVMFEEKYELGSHAVVDRILNKTND